MIDALMENLELFFVPTFINIMREITDSRILWMNDTADSSSYSMIQKTLIMGFHPKLKVPFVLNYAADTELMEANFLMSSVWASLKEWIRNERNLINRSEDSTSLPGNYVFRFNKRMELVYLSFYSKEVFANYFKFPTTITNYGELSLQNIVNGRELSDTIQQLVQDMEDSREHQCELSHPSMTVRLVFIGDRLKGFSLVLRAEPTPVTKTEVSLEALQYAMTPISFIKHLDGDWEDSVLQENIAILQEKDSIILQMDKKKEIRKSEFSKKTSGFALLRAHSGLSPIGRITLPNLESSRSKKEGGTNQGGFAFRSRQLVKMKSQFSQQPSSFYDSQAGGKGKSRVNFMSSGRLL